jgi:hypothetical protein
MFVVKAMFPISGQDISGTESNILHHYQPAEAHPAYQESLTPSAIGANLLDFPIGNGNILSCCACTV